MSVEWTIKTIGELCDEKDGSVQTGPFGSQLHASDYIDSDEGIPVVMPVNLVGNRINREGIACIGQDDYKRLEKYHLKRGDIVYARRGDVGRQALVTEREDGWLCGTGCLRIRFNNPNIIPRYVSYYLSQEHVKEYVLSSAVGSTMPNLNTQILRSIPIQLPELSVQKRIVEILGSLDKKVEINHRINQTLEEMAMILYKHWFINFGPFQDGEFQKTVLGKIPKGWEVKKVKENINLILGGTPSRKKTEYWNGNIPWINSGKVNEFRIVSPTEYITEEGLKKSATKLLPKGTTVLAITGATLGQISRLEIEACANQSVIGLLENEFYSSEFLYLWLHNVINDLLKQQTGGAQQHINKGNVEDLEIIFPDIKVRIEFQKIIEPIFEQISTNSLENENLKQTRDYLLSQLLSNEKEINGSDIQVEEVL